MCSEFPIAPTVARHAAGTRRISPEGNEICAQPASRAINVADVPADLQRQPPRPG